MPSYLFADWSDFLYRSIFTENFDFIDETPVFFEIFLNDGRNRTSKSDSINEP